MKPLSPRSRLKGDPFLPNRFIFGDAIDQHGIEEYEYLVHTEQPTFVCRLMHRAIPFDGADSEQFASAMLFDPEENVSYYTCNDGLAMTDFELFSCMSQYRFVVSSFWSISFEIICKILTCCLIAPPYISFLLFGFFFNLWIFLFKPLLCGSIFSLVCSFDWFF